EVRGELEAKPPERVGAASPEPSAELVEELDLDLDRAARAVSQDGDGVDADVEVEDAAARHREHEADVVETGADRALRVGAVVEGVARERRAYEVLRLAVGEAELEGAVGIRRERAMSWQAPRRIRDRD